MTEEEAKELNDLFAQLDKTVKAAKVRKLLERINRIAHRLSGGVVVQRVNWNSLLIFAIFIQLFLLYSVTS